MKKLNRKTFFKGLALTTISLPLAIRSCGPINHAQNTTSPNIINGKKYRWKMVTTWPPNFPIMGEGCQHFADWVFTMSGGRMEIKVFGGNELVPSLEAFDAVRSGAAEIGHGSPYYWSGKVPAAQFFASVPFGMNAQQRNAWFYAGGGLELWDELYAEYGLKPFPGGNTGVQMGGWFNKEINSIDDFKGLKMRIPGLAGKVLEAAGGSPVLLAGGELYTGLERGVIDATEWIGPFHDYQMGFHEIAKYYYAPGWHEMGTALEFFINRDKYEALPADLQEILKTAAARLNVEMLAEGEVKNAGSLEKIKAAPGVEIRQFTPDTMRDLRRITNQVVGDFANSDPKARKIFDSIQEHRRKLNAWADLSEKVYYQEIM